MCFLGSEPKPGPSGLSRRALRRLIKEQELELKKGNGDQDKMDTKSLDSHDDFGETHDDSGETYKTAQGIGKLLF